MVRYAPLIAAFVFSAGHAAGNDPPLDDFRDPSAWTATASDGVDASLQPVDAPGGRGLCLDYDFNGFSGYAVARRVLAIDYPPNYAFDFQLRGDGPANNLEFKLVDASGDNVWWVRKPDVALPAQWTPQSFKRRMVEFAWGPATDHELRRSAALELTVSAGKGGGKGPRLHRRALPARVAGGRWFAAGGNAGAWRRRLGLRPRPRARIRRRDPALESRRVRFRLRHRVVGRRRALAQRPRSSRQRRRRGFIALPESEARYLRIAPGNGGRGGPRRHRRAAAGVRGHANDFVRQVAMRAPRGEYPRGFVGEQPYWTLLGVDGGHEQG